MPTEEGRRGDEKGDPAVTRDDSTRRREEDPVDGPELAWARRPLQHPELMAENEDLEVLGSVDSTSPSSADEETDEGADDEVEERQHRRSYRGCPSANRGFRPRRDHASWTYGGPGPAFLGRDAVVLLTIVSRCEPRLELDGHTYQLY
jgi:hypothetical protein